MFGDMRCTNVKILFKKGKIVSKKILININNNNRKKIFDYLGKYEPIIESLFDAPIKQEIFSKHSS